MNKTIKSFLTAVLVLSLILTAISSVFAHLAMVKEFDHELGYYVSGSVFAALGMYLPIISVVIGIVCIVFLRRRVSFKKMPDVTVFTIFAAALTGLLMIVSGIMTLLGNNPLPLETGVAIVGIISGLYFLSLSFFENKGFMSLLSFAPPIWAALELLEEYFRKGSPINSPIRTVNLTMFAFLLLFLAEEIRFYIDKQNAGTWYFCNLTALVFTGAAIFPKIAVFFSNNSRFKFTFIELCLGATVFLYILTRTISASKALGEYTKAEIKVTANESEANNE